jgi:hypothetical protein
VVSQVPDQWLPSSPDQATADDLRAAYVEHLMARLAAAQSWLPVAA